MDLHPLLTTYSMFFPNAFPLFSGFLFQNNNLLLQKNSSKPAPFQRHSKSLYAAAKLECELRHCGHLLRCSDLTKGTGSCGFREGEEQVPFMKGTNDLPTVTGSRHAPKQYCLYNKKPSIIFYPSSVVLPKNRRSCYEITVAQGPSKAELRVDGRSIHLTYFEFIIITQFLNLNWTWHN